MATKPEPEHYAVRHSDDLVESEIAMLGRMGRSRSRKARILGRIAALFILVPILLGIVLQVLKLI